MDQLKNILVAVDFSPCSAAALRQATRIAAWSGATVTALHVIPIPVIATDPQPVFPIIFPEVPLLMNEAREHWSKWPAARGLPNPVTFDVVLGSPRLEILDRVEREKPDLLVLGAHGELDVKRGVGSTAAGCAQRAPTRVLLVREGQMERFRSVVACVDFTETSRSALEQAIRVAAVDNAALHILHVYEDPWRNVSPPKEITTNLPDLAQRYHQAIEQRLKAFCDPLAHEIGALKAALHVMQSDGHGKGIVNFITRERCDLAVLGTRAKWNLRDFFLGSTAERVVREAPCAALTVKPQGFQAA